MKPEDDETLRTHATEAKAKGWCEQCQYPWNDGLCECGHYGDPEVKKAEERGHHLLDESE